MKPAPVDPLAADPGGCARNDPRLTPWLTAPTGREASDALERLLEELAAPVLARVIRGKLGAADQSHDAADLMGEARLQIIRRLQRLREPPEGAAGDFLSDFPAYVAAVAYTTWAQAVRRANPARAALVDRLRYLLEGRTNQRGFALWTDPGSKSWAGFEAWRAREKFLVKGGPNTTRLLADPAGTAASIFGPGTAWEVLPLPDVLGALFTWLGEPLRLRDLTEVVAQWQGIPSGRMEVLAAAAEEEAASEIPSAGPSPHDELRWKEYLAWLLDAVTRLTVRQRTAFLLHSTCLHEMERLGLTGIRHTASLLDLPPERMAGYWADVPLEDRVIGTILDLGTQGVINSRKAARVILGRAWQDLLQGN